MLQRFNLADTLNAHIARGVTTAHGIVMMSAGELTLASGNTLLVAMMRNADQATLIVDSGKSLERAWCVIPTPRPRRRCGEAGAGETPVAQWTVRPEGAVPTLDISM